MRPSAIFLKKEIPKFQVTLPALAARMWPGHVTTVEGEREKEGRKEWERRGQGGCMTALSQSIGGPPPGPIKLLESKLAASAV